MARYPHQAAAARHLGADQVLTGRDHYEEIARLTGARLYVGLLHNKMLLGGYDVIYDAVGSARTIHDCLRWARGGGTLVVVGIRPTLMTVDLSPVWHQEVTLMGSLGHGIEDWQGGHMHAFDLVVHWMQEGRLPTDGLITHRFPLEEYKRAIATATDKRTGAIKVVLQV
jgi:threonine dehydrogenase-like Zn-dependent dehydrogenase